MEINIKNMITRTLMCQDFSVNIIFFYFFIFFHLTTSNKINIETDQVQKSFNNKLDQTLLEAAVDAN